MPSRIIPGLSLRAFWALGEAGWKAGMDENIWRLSYLAQSRIMGIVDELPDTPANGDRYIINIPLSPNHNRIAVYDVDIWSYIEPEDRFVVFNTENDSLMYFNEANAEWVALISPEAIKEAYEENADTNAFTDTEKTKLAGVENNATADMSAAEIKAAYESNLNTNVFTDAEKAKLGGLSSSRFLGVYPTLSNLRAAHSAPPAGSFAYVDAGANVDIVSYIWDANDTKYVPQASGNTQETPESVKAKYEANDDTNAFTDAEKAKLAEFDPDAPSLPAGGVTGQVLAKNSNADGDAVWIDPPDTEDELPAMAGQDGKLLSVASGSPVWVDPPEIPEVEDELPVTTGQNGKVLGVVDEEPAWVDLPEIPEVDVQEAPIDGKVYGRRNESWQEITVSSGGEAGEDAIYLLQTLGSVDFSTGSTSFSGSQATKSTVFNVTKDVEFFNIDLNIFHQAGQQLKFFIGFLNGANELTEILYESPTAFTTTASGWVRVFSGRVQFFDGDKVVMGLIRTEGAATLVSRPFGGPNTITNSGLNSEYVNYAVRNVLTVGDSYATVNYTGTMHFRMNYHTVGDYAALFYDRMENQLDQSGMDLNLETVDFIGNVFKQIESALDVMINIPAGLRVAQPVSFLRKGSGQIRFVPAAGVTLLSADGFDAIRTRYSVATLVPVGYNNYVLAGDIGEYFP